MPKKTIFHEINREIGAKLRLVRQCKQLSQQNVSDDIGVSTTAYSKMENGKTEFSVTRLFQLANYFEIHLPDLLDSRVSVPRCQNEVGKMVDYGQHAVELTAAQNFLNEILNRKK